MLEFRCEVLNSWFYLCVEAFFEEWFCGRQIFFDTFNSFLAESLFFVVWFFRKKDEVSEVLKCHFFAYGILKCSLPYPSSC